MSGLGGMGNLSGVGDLGDLGNLDCLGGLCGIDGLGGLGGLGSRTSDNFMPLAVNQLLLRRTLGASLEPQAVQDKHYLGASRHQQDLVSQW